MRVEFPEPYRFVNDRGLLKRIEMLREEKPADPRAFLDAFPVDLILRLEIQDWLDQRGAKYTLEVDAITFEDAALAMEFKMRWL